MQLWKCSKISKKQECRLQNVDITSNIEWNVMQIALIHSPFI
jgi:hypothetical protein